MEINIENRKTYKITIGLPLSRLNMSQINNMRK